MNDTILEISESSPRSCANYRDAAITLWGEAGEYCHDCYTEVRRLYFPELPEHLPIVCGITAYGKCLGATQITWGSGPRITIASNQFGKGSQVVRDVMIHECLHASLFLTGQDTKHNSDAWYDAVQRLSPAVLGQAVDVKRGADKKSIRVPNPNWYEGSRRRKTVVRKVRDFGVIAHATVARWPYSMRPSDYECGPVILCPSY